MKKSKMTRRQAVSELSRLALVVAGAHGLARGGVSALGQTSATTARLPNLEKLANIKAGSYNARIIKGLLIPRQDVFISEFGRTPGDMSVNANGLMGCEFFVQAMQGSSCTEQNCGRMGGCNDNSCGEQHCGHYNGSCGNNNCGNQFKLAGASCGQNNQIFSTQFLDTIKADPFIQALMRELNVTNTAALSTELRAMLTFRQQTIPR
jgi:hypothetical protein